MSDDLYSQAYEEVYGVKKINIAKARSLIVSIKSLAAFLTEEEVEAIGVILLKAVKRIEKK